MINDYLVHKTDKLRQLILENPDLPLFVFVGQYAASDWAWTACSDVKAKIGEVMDCNPVEDEERIYTDREEFEDMISDYYSSDFNGTDAEYDELVENKLKEYEPYWKKCIILYADN